MMRWASEVRNSESIRRSTFGNDSRGQKCSASGDSVKTEDREAAGGNDPSSESARADEKPSVSDVASEASEGASEASEGASEANPPVRHAYSQPAARSSVSPRARPGYASREIAVDNNDRARLLAAIARACIGLLFVVVALHFLPIHMITPIMTGMGVLMVVTGAYAAWLVGRAEPRLALIAKTVVWGVPLLTVVALGLTMVVGAGTFSPAIQDLVGR